MTQQIRTPDGVIHRFPDEATPEQIQSTLNNTYANSKAIEAPREGPAPFEGMTRAMQQGATFGLADEVGGAGAYVGRMLKNLTQGDTGISAADAYNRNVNDERLKRQQFAKDRPGLNLAGELLGGVGTMPAGALKAADGALAVEKTAMPAWMNGALGDAAPGWLKSFMNPEMEKTLVRQTGENAVAGAMQGAAGGAGSADGSTQDRLAAALVGGGFGGTLGAALPTITAAGGKIFNGIKNTLGLQDEAVAAERNILRALARDKVTLKDVEGRAKDLAQAMPDKPITLTDIAGPNTLGLADAAYNQPGADKKVIHEFLSKRQSDQTGRLAADVRDLLSPGQGSYYEIADTLDRMRKAAAKPLYEEAYAGAAPPLAGELLDLMKRPSLKEAAARAFKIAAEEGRNPTELGFRIGKDGEIELGAIPTVHTLDYMKRGLDDVVEQFRDKVTNKLVLDNAGRAINDTRANFRNQITLPLDQGGTEGTEALGKALRAYAGPSAGLDAQALGREIFSREFPDPQSVLASFANKSDFEKDMFRVGVAQAITDKIGQVADRNDAVKRFFDSKTNREKLKNIFPNAEEFQRFADRVNAEGNMYLTNATITKGSPTAPRTAGQKDLNEGEGTMETATKAAGNVATGNWLSAAGRVAQLASNRVQGINAPVADDLGKMLMTGVNNIDPTINRLSIRQYEDLLKALIGQDVTRQASGLLGREAGMTYGQTTAPRMVRALAGQ